MVFAEPLLKCAVHDSFQCNGFFRDWDPRSIVDGLIASFGGAIRRLYLAILRAV